MLMKINGVDCWVMCIGYMGEDGFEIFVSNVDAMKFVERLEFEKEVCMVVFGLCDFLCFEVGLCLYGNDLNEDIILFEVGLVWIIGKVRREFCDFIGGEIIKK